MRTQILLMAAVMGFGLAVQAEDLPQIVDVQYHTSYVPNGFDNNDNVQMVVEGIFSNSCYRPALPQVSVDKTNRTVTVTGKAYKYDGFCLQMLVPFHQVLDLGLMNVGSYSINQMDNGKMTSFGRLGIQAATTSSPDDFLYAPISQAYFKQVNGQNVVTISGNFTNSCVSLSDVIVNVQPNVITVQPISEVANRTDCVTGTFPFERTTSIGPMNPGRYLLHVRSLNAQAVNTLVDVR